VSVELVANDTLLRQSTSSVGPTQSPKFKNKNRRS
jgi:hypothetical protein